MKLTDDEHDWCEVNPSVLEELAEIHDGLAAMSAASGIGSPGYHDTRGAELREEAKAIRQSWED